MSSQQITQIAPPLELWGASHPHPGYAPDGVTCATSQEGSGSAPPLEGKANAATRPAPNLTARRPRPRQLDIIFSASWNKATRQVSTHIRLQLEDIRYTVGTTSAETYAEADSTRSPVLSPLTRFRAFSSPAESTRHAKFLALEQALREASTWLGELHIRPQCISLKIATHNRIIYVPRKRGKTGKLRISEARTWTERCLRDDIYRHLDGYRSWWVVHTHKQVAKSILGLLLEKTVTNAKQAETTADGSIERGVGAASQGVGAAAEQPGEVRQVGEAVSAVYADAPHAEPLSKNTSAQREHKFASPGTPTHPTVLDGAGIACEQKGLAAVYGSADNSKPANGSTQPGVDKGIGEAPVCPEPVETVPQFPIALTITFDGGLTGAGLAYGRYRIACSAAPALKLNIQIDLGKLVVFGQKVTQSSDATEYLAVFTALRHAQRLLRRDKIDLNLVQVQVFSDSQNLTQQLQHTWHTNSPELLHLQTQLELELARFGKWQVDWLGKLQIDHALKAIPMPARPATQLAYVAESSIPLVQLNAEVSVVERADRRSAAVKVGSDPASQSGAGTASVSTALVSGECYVSANSVDADQSSVSTLSASSAVSGNDGIRGEASATDLASSAVCATTTGIQTHPDASGDQVSRVIDAEIDPAEAARSEVMLVVAEVHEQAAAEHARTSGKRKAFQLPVDIETAITERLSAYIAEHPLSVEVQERLRQAMRHVAYQQMQMPRTDIETPGAQGGAGQSRTIQIGFAPAHASLNAQVAQGRDRNWEKTLNQAAESARPASNVSVALGTPISIAESQWVPPQSGLRIAGERQAMWPQTAASRGLESPGATDALDSEMAEKDKKESSAPDAVVTNSVTNPTLLFYTHPTSTASASLRTDDLAAADQVAGQTDGIASDQVVNPVAGQVENLTSSQAAILAACRASSPALSQDGSLTGSPSASLASSSAESLAESSASSLAACLAESHDVSGRTGALLPDSPTFQAQRWLQMMLATPRATWGSLQPIPCPDNAGEVTQSGSDPAADPAEADDLDAALRLVAVRTYAELNLAVQRSHAVGPYRIWLLSRYLDTQGEGKLPLATLNAALCDATAGLHMTNRQLQNLLAAGEGIFWDRYKIGRETMVKLRGAGRVALYFKLDKLRYRAAYVPIDWLRMGHGAAECVLYTALHAARGHDERNNAPISRETLSGMTGRSIRTLLLYDRVAGTTRRTNIAHTGIASHTEDLDLIKDAYGPAAFTMGRGYKFGKPQGLEVVLRLPNSYRSTLVIQAQNIGRKKRVNQVLMGSLTGSLSDSATLKSGLKKAVLEDALKLESQDTLTGTTLVGIGEQAAQIKVGREIEHNIGHGEQKDQDGQAEKKTQVGSRNRATREAYVKRERVFYDDLQSARDMTAARRAVSARLRGQLADPDLPAAQRPRFEERILHMERGFYSLNRVEDGVGRYVIMGNLSIGSEPKPVIRERDVQGLARGVHPDQLDHDLKQVRKEFERTRKSRVQTLRFDVRNSKVQSDARCDIQKMK